MIHGHGGGIDALARSLGCPASEIIDLSSNINPIGPIPELMDHLRSAVETAVSLPEPDAATAVAAQADVIGIPAAWLVAGNGTTELIYSTPRALGTRRALIIGPTYSDYADACHLAGASVGHCMARATAGFVLSPDRIIKAARAADTVFWCNPNNPTGVWTPPDVVADICRNCPDTRFILDESYLAFLDDGDSCSLIRHRLPNAVILVSFSKMDALAGFRIGFVAAPPLFADRFRQNAAPWSMNRLAQAAVVYLAAHPKRVAAHRRSTRRHLARVRPALLSALSDMLPITWTHSNGSFVLGSLPSAADAVALVNGLKQRRMMIRHCRNFHGLSGRYVRISLKTEAVHERLRSAVAEIRQRSPFI